MKKLITLFLFVILILTLAACSGSAVESADAASVSQLTSEIEEAADTAVTSQQTITATAVPAACCSIQQSISCNPDGRL